jgi:hypothetical protein
MVTTPALTDAQPGPEQCTKERIHSFAFYSWPKPGGLFYGQHGQEHLLPAVYL